MALWADSGLFPGRELATHALPRVAVDPGNDSI